MLTPEQRISVNATAVEIFEYDNGSVAFLNPEFPTWVRSSSTGLWIFQYLKEKPSTASETVSAVADYYGLPTDVVSGSTGRFLEEMIYNGFLAQHASHEKEGLSTLSKVVELSELGLQQLWLDVTSLCNGACRHCYKPKNDTYHFPVSQLEDLLAQAKTLGVANLTITGGEPLLHPEFSHIMTLARKVSDWTITVITAGQRTSSEIVDAIMENADIVQVSLDGLDKETNDLLRGDGAFESAVMLLKCFHEHKDRDSKKIGISFTPLPQNIERMVSLRELGYALGIDFIHINNVKQGTNYFRGILNNELNSQDLFKKSLWNFEQLARKIWDGLSDIGSRENVRPIFLDRSFPFYYDLFNPVKKRSCKAGITTLSVTEKGDVYPCVALQGFSEPHLGNWIRERDLPGLYTRARHWNESVFSVDDCHQCKACHFRYLCGGGCRARSDSPGGPDIMCEAIRESYHGFLEFAGPFALKGISKELLLDETGDREGDIDHEQRKSRSKLRQCA